MNKSKATIPTSGVLLVMPENKAAVAKAEMAPSQRLQNRLRRAAATPDGIVLLPDSVQTNSNQTSYAKPPRQQWWNNSFLVKIVILLGILLLVALAIKAQSSNPLQGQIDDLTKAQIQMGLVQSTNAERLADVERRVDKIESGEFDVKIAEIETREETNRWLLYAIATGILGLIGEAASRALVVLAKGKKR